MSDCRLAKSARRTVIACGWLLVSVAAGHAADCGMAQAFKQPDGNAKTGFTRVWSDREAKALFFIEGLNVNTDGTRRSYSVDDFWGEETALNNLCNAMSDACAGLSKDGLRSRRLLTQKAFANGWPAELLAQTKIAPAIIPFKGGKPCPPVDGFLVSATALHKPNVADVCDIGNYADALVTPALVLPKNPAKNTLSEFAKRHAKVGDLAVALVPGSSAPVFAVVGDTGPAKELGEGSVALNGKLLGKNAAPANYQEVRGKGAFKGKAWTVPQAMVLIFPASGDSVEPYLTPERIDAAAQKLFEDWGGVARLNACAADYGR
ncbi:glycoside hydrolase family 75 protein [Methylomonas koyamae]|uniref:glycoside hydrolase family 75 protein n=1 Tax=Methylomonas koyamae TaxID=702114 RepID=UPI001C90D2A7|nr:glycoside hydrolase family 75 protein [Methylomonas koyamae]